MKTNFPVMPIVRRLCIVAANVAFFMGLAAICPVKASAIFYIAPLFIAALSVIFPGEKVGPGCLIAVCIGLAGVIVMLRPGSAAFRTAALLPLFSAFAYACMPTLTRRLA